MATRMPVLFVGHGSPLYAIQDNEWSRGFRSLSGLIPRPRAILAVSAHWCTPGTFITGNSNPETIHDFHGFPRELHEVQYPAPGDPELARRVQSLIGPEWAELRSDWGFDHGTWSVLRWMYPEADVPVIQLSINHTFTMSDHFDLARLLAPLRRDGVLIFGTGNVTHNLRDLMQRMQREDFSTPEWALQFDNAVEQAATTRDRKTLLELWPNAPGARQAHPSPDHFFPILYTAAVADPAEPVRFPIEGFDRSVSMRSILWG